MPDDIIKPDPSYDMAKTVPPADASTTNTPAETAAPATTNPEPTAQINPTPVVAQTTPQTTAPASPEQTEEEKRKAAMLAMEGPERTAHREQMEKEHEAKEKQAGLKNRLAEIAKLKEKLEIAWVDLDSQRKKLKTDLEPTINQEKQIEAEEQAVEQEETQTALPKEKHVIEEKRWAIAEKRKAVEQAKWLVEEKIVKIEEQIEANTTQYRTLLDEEEKVQASISELASTIL